MHSVSHAASGAQELGGDLDQDSSDYEGRAGGSGSESVWPGHDSDSLECDHEVENEGELKILILEFT